MGPHFSFDQTHDPSTLAYVVISGPSFFEACVLPHLNSTLANSSVIITNEDSPILTDPLDNAVVDAFKLAQNVRNDYFRPFV